MLYPVEIDKKDDMLALTGPQKYIDYVIDSFEYDLKKHYIDIQRIDGKLYIDSDDYDLDDLAESLVVDDELIVDPKCSGYPIIADWEA